MELEQRGKSAGTVAAERAEQVKELSVRAETAELLAAERESQIKELEARALSAEADAKEQARQVCAPAVVHPWHRSPRAFFFFMWTAFDLSELLLSSRSDRRGFSFSVFASFYTSIPSLRHKPHARL